jgi:hypothetical protein
MLDSAKDINRYALYKYTPLLIHVNIMSQQKKNILKHLTM